jgi:O-succinylbenzoic acid--CoA ligase
VERTQLEKLVGTTGCAVVAGGVTFLTDPAWPEALRTQAGQAMALRAMDGPEGRGWLCVQTGGTSGEIRFARHDEQTLGAAARGFLAHFGLARVNAVDVLPPHHVSGLMARIRCAVSGGDHRPWTWKRLEAGDWPALPERGEGWVISLVPTQLQRLLATSGGVDWLRGFRLVFLGGGPVWASLAEAASAARVPVVLSYGMTETAAMVAAQRPEEFPGGDRTCGRALPHARVMVDAEGAVSVAGESLFRGYWPANRREGALLTEDIGMMDAAGRLSIAGRRDAVIITGGKKVQPARVEGVLRAALGGAAVVVVGLPDAGWGETVVACVPRDAVIPSPDHPAFAGLAAHERPKRWVEVDPWPVNAQGKVNRALLRSAAAGQVR